MATDASTPSSPTGSCTDLDLASYRFRGSQKNRTLIHPTLPQPPITTAEDSTSPFVSETSTSRSKELSVQPHTFVVCADTQYGLTNESRNWEVEIEFSRQAVKAINALEPKPLYCCVCGDIADMTANIFAGTKKPPNRNAPAASAAEQGVYTEQECNAIQDLQNKDFIDEWSNLDPSIALVCLCGNHDVGNRPSAVSIQRFTETFGDDYLAFWAGTTYNIVLNTNLFSDSSLVPDLLQEQLQWLQDRLEAVTTGSNKPSHIFVFGHHPWFLYRDDETAGEMKGISPLPPNWGSGAPFIADSYFHIPLEKRKRAMELFELYNVTAAFSGHFHQNLVSKSSFGMDMIITSSLSLLFESTGKPLAFDEPAALGFRIVTVNNDATNGGRGTFQHKFVSL